MDYKSADSQLRGRNNQSRKIANNTYLRRRSETTDAGMIAVELHSTDVLEFHKNGDIRVNTGGWDTPTTRGRINDYLGRPWHVHNERGRTVLSNFHWNGKSGTGSKQVGTQEAILSSSAWIRKGKIVGGEDIEARRVAWKQEDLETRRERARQRRWVTLARGLYLDKSACTAQGRWNCHYHMTGGFGRTRRRHPLAESIAPCGCRVYRKAAPQRTIDNLTVAGIMAERNVSVRQAQIKLYGIERFFLDAGAKVVHETAGYQLICLDMGINGFVADREMKALKMVCPSTGAVYVETVPPNVDTVPEALDWKFDIKDYLGQVSQQA